jgi:two-component system KDP operon response regulator KdpE
MPPEPEQAASPPAPAPPPVVVLIEDEPQIRRFLRATLGTQGYRLYEATSGEDGLIEAASRQPDVVILDLGLPDLDGLEVIRRLREWSRVPIIVLSARGQERDKVAALAAGADHDPGRPGLPADERRRLPARQVGAARHCRPMADGSAGAS